MQSFHQQTQILAAVVIICSSFFLNRDSSVHFSSITHMHLWRGTERWLAKKTFAILVNLQPTSLEKWTATTIICAWESRSRADCSRQETGQTGQPCTKLRGFSLRISGSMNPRGNKNHLRHRCPLPEGSTYECHASSGPEIFTHKFYQQWCNQDIASSKFHKLY